MRDGIDTGVTGPTYTVTQADVGANITVEARYTDGQGTDEVVSSNSSGVVANTNDAPLGNVTISGMAVENERLTVSDNLADEDGLGPITYHWLRDGIDTGVTGSSYTLTQADVGTNITAEARYTDGEGTSEAVASNVIGPIADTNNAPTGTVTISGTPTEGQTLTVADTLADADGLGPITYHWFRDGVDSGITGSNFTLTQADVGTTITVEARYTDDDGAAETVGSNSIGPVSRRLSISPIENQIIEEDSTTDALRFTIGDPQETTVTASSSNPQLIPDANLTLVHLGGDLWTVAAESAPNQTGTATITVTVGDGSAATTETFDVTVTPVNDSPTVTGIANQTISEDARTQPLTFAVADIDSPLGSLLVNASSNNPALIADSSIQLADLGDGDWTVEVAPLANESGETLITLTVSDGTESTTTSFTVVVQSVNDAPAGQISVEGTPAVGETLTATVSDADGIGVVSYQWQRNGVPIPGETEPTLVLTTQDVGANINVQATFRDGGGESENLQIDGVDVPLLIGPPTIASSAEVRTETEPVDETETETETNSDDDSELQPTLAMPLPSVNRPRTSESTPQQIIELVTEDVPVEQRFQVLIRGATTAKAKFNSERTVRDSDPTTTDLDITPLRLSADQTRRLQQLSTPGALWQDLDEVKDGKQIDLGDGVVVGTAMTGASLTAGYVIWTIRSGVLLTTFLAQMPAWRMIDPMVVMSGFSDEEEDDESLDSIAEGKSSPTKNSNSTPQKQK